MKVTTVIFIVSLLMINKAHCIEESYIGEENNDLSENEQNESAEEEDDAPSPQSEDTNDDNPENEVKIQEHIDDVTSNPPLNIPHKEREENSLVSNFNRYSSVPGENSFSFHHFNGPISKEVRQVVVPNSNPLQPGAHSVDFAGKPDYSFAYGVHDDQLKNSHTHMESRDGDALRGEYRVLQPDGLVRIVRYFSDPLTGFQMKVEYAKI